MRGTQQTINTENASTLVLPFDPAAADISRSGNDLVFEADGGTITITDFFVVGDAPLPDLKLPDGTTVSSGDLLAGMGLDITTAAGPASPGSSGLNPFDGAVGSLIGGVGTMDVQGGDFSWSNATTTPDGVFMALATAADAATTPAGATPGDTASGSGSTQGGGTTPPPVTTPNQPPVANGGQLAWAAPIDSVKTITVADALHGASYNDFFPDTIAHSNSK